MIGLGVGIDYALFIVTRHLEQRRDGMATRRVDRPRDRDAPAARSSSPACTVMIALLSLAIVGIPLVTTLGYTSALVVAVAVLARDHAPAGGAGAPRRPDRQAAASRCPTARRTTAARTAGTAGASSSRGTRCPSALVAIGDPGRARDPGARPLPRPAGQRRAAEEHGGAQGLRRHDERPSAPAPTARCSSASTCPRSRPRPTSRNLDKINKTEKDDKDKAQTKADDQEQQVAEQLEAEGVPPDEGAAAGRAAGPARPAEAARPDHAEGRTTSARRRKNLATDPRLQDLRDDLKKTKGVKSVTEPLVNKDGTAAVITATPTTAPSDEATDRAPGPRSATTSSRRRRTART